MSGTRGFAIHDGVLTGDLDANGFRIRGLGLTAEDIAPALDGLFVTPDAEAKEGQAADAKATYEALEEKIGTDKLSPPDAAARQYDVADAKSTYEAILEHSSPVRKYVVVSGKYEEDQMPAFIDMEEGLAYDADPDSQGKPFPKPTELLRGGDTVFELYNPMGYQDGIDLWFNGYIVVLAYGYRDVYEYSCPLGAIMPVDTMWLTARVADAGDGEKILILDLI